MKTLVLVFHPHLEKSQVNRKLMDAANETGDVTVVDEYAGINFRGGMDFYARKNFGALTDDAGEQFEVNPIKKIGESVVR